MSTLLDLQLISCESSEFSSLNQQSTKGNFVKKVKIEDMQHVAEGVSGPIYLGNGESINRGNVVCVDGNEGVVCDIRHMFDVTQDPDEAYFIDVFWFSGPLSEDKTKRQRAYSFAQYLRFIGMELEYA